VISYDAIPATPAFPDQLQSWFGLPLATSGQAARERLARLPHYALTLGHDITANIDVLSKIAFSL
jgi:hypothetical protein